MAEVQQKQKHVYFYRVVRERKHEMRLFGGSDFIDWYKVLDDFQKRSWQERSHGDFMYSVNTVDDFRIVSIAEAVDSRGFVGIDADNGELHDLTPQALADGKLKLGQVSLLLFYQLSGVVAYMSFSSRRPSISKVKNFLNFAFPRDDCEWSLLPVFQVDGYEKFLRDVPSTYEVKASFDTSRTTIGNDNSGGIVDLAYQLSDEAGFDLNLTMQVSIPKRSRNRKAGKIFAGKILSMIRHSRDQGRPVTVKYETVDGVMETLNLEPHVYVQSIGIPDQKPGEQYTGFLPIFAHLCKQQEDTVKSLVEGSTER